MFTSMDLLIIVVLALFAAGIAALALMFLLKNNTAKRICLYIVAALGLYIGYAGAYINYPGFMTQVVLAVLFALAGAAAVVIERIKKSETAPLLSRVIAAAALVLGMANAFLI